jgi:hypothetical protein
MNGHNNQRQEINQQRHHLRAERNDVARSPSLPPSRFRRYENQEQRISPRVGLRTQPLATGFETASLRRKSPIRPVLSPVQPEPSFTFVKPKNDYAAPSLSRGQPTRANNLQPQCQNRNLQRYEREPYQNQLSNLVQDRNLLPSPRSSGLTHPKNPLVTPPHGHSHPTTDLRLDPRKLAEDTAIADNRAAADKEHRKQRLRAEFILRYTAETSYLKSSRNQLFWSTLLLASILLLMVAYYNSRLTPKTKPYCDDNNTTDTCTACPQNSNCSRGRVVSCTADYDFHAGLCIHHQADAQQTRRQVQAAVLLLAQHKGKLTCEDSIFHASFSRATIQEFLANFRTDDRFELNRDQALTILMTHPMIQYDTKYEYQSRNIKYTPQCFTAMFLHEFKVPVLLITLFMMVLVALIYDKNAKVSKRDTAGNMYSFLENEVKKAVRPMSEHTLRSMLFESFGLSFQEVDNLWPEVLVHVDGNRGLKHITGDQAGHPVRCWVRN